MIYGGEARREQIAEILMSCPDLWHKENALSAADKVLATPSASPLRDDEYRQLEQLHGKEVQRSIALEMECDRLRAAADGGALAEYYRKGLKSIVDCVNPMTRAAVREACADILAAAPASPLRGREPPIAMVAAAQKAILNHPYFHDGAAIAFGFANTAVKAALSALPSKQPAAEDK